MFQEATNNIVCCAFENSENVAVPTCESRAGTQAQPQCARSPRQWEDVDGIPIDI
jgi:hypothetical protein